MDRRHYLVTYDISDDKRRTTVYEILLGQGDHAQYSVFFCELSDRELVALRSRLRSSINAAEDQILIVDLGRSVRPLEVGLEVLGKPYTPSIRTVVV
jgi:CRISPR-associated protein Cas2